MRRTALPGIACTTLLAVGLAVVRAFGVVPLTTVRVASGLDRPIFVTHPPGDEARLFIVEQRGVVKILDLSTETITGTFLDIDALVGGPGTDADERGLLGLAFHPDYARNGFFYVKYTSNDPNTVVARYAVSANPDAADPSSAVTIVALGQPSPNHCGGWLGFGPDGYLYVPTGDGGHSCDVGAGHTARSGNAQDLTSNLLGKILRLIPSTTPGAGGYTVPATNPFVGVGGDDEIWAYGLRNPWRCSFDRLTGDLYIADVGQHGWEEVDFQPAGSTGGENYGWRCFEGNSCSSISGCPTTPCDCDPTGMTFPIHQYTSVPRCITGGYVYRGCDIPSLRGTYFFADFIWAHIWTFEYANGRVTGLAERSAELSPIGGYFIAGIASFGEDARGETYIVDRGNIQPVSGEIFKIIAASGLPDFDCDGHVDVVDFLTLLAHWGPCTINACAWDLDRDGTVGIADFLSLLSQWGP